MSHAVSPAIRDQAIEAAAQAHGVCAKDILSDWRNHKVAHARQEAMVTLRSITDAEGRPRYSLPAIGRAFGRDHTTVLYALRQAQKREAMQ